MYTYIDVYEWGQSFTPMFMIPKSTQMKCRS